MSNPRRELFEPSRSYRTMKVYSHGEISVTLPNRTIVVPEGSGTMTVFNPPSWSIYAAPAPPYFTTPYNYYPHVVLNGVGYYQNQTTNAKDFLMYIQESGKNTQSCFGTGVNFRYSAGTGTHTLMQEMQNTWVQGMLNGYHTCYRMDVEVTVISDERVRPIILTHEFMSAESADNVYNANFRTYATSLSNTSAQNVYPHVCEFRRHKSKAICTYPLQRCWDVNNSTTVVGYWSSVSADLSHTVPEPRGVGFHITWPGYYEDVAFSQQLYGDCFNGGDPIPPGVAFGVGKILISTTQYFLVREPFYRGVSANFDPGDFREKLKKLQEILNNLPRCIIYPQVADEDDMEDDTQEQYTE